VKSLHGTALGLALDASSPLLGVLILGGPGAGKSRLAAELIDGCVQGRTGLIADDLISLSDEGVLLPAPQGPLLHLRGLGIARVRAAEPCPLRFVLALGGAALGESFPLPKAADVIPVPPEAAYAAAVRLLLASLASGETLWCGFEPGP
jgi:hypothetical protein